jgi:dienelactone hydrolase
MNCLKKTKTQLVFWLFTVAAITVHADVCQHELPATDTFKEAVYFYPCDIREPSPAVTLSGGYGNTYRNLQWMAEALAEADYVVLAITPTNIYGKVEQWRNAHIEGQKTLVSTNASADSPLAGKINTNKRAIAGFSMGGGATLLAGTELKGEIKALAAFAPFLLKEERNVAPVAPTLILAGERDLLVTNESIVEISSHVVSSAKDHLIASYRNGRHQQWYRAEITTNRDSYKELTIAWFNRYLKGDDSGLTALKNVQEGKDSPFSFVSSSL